MERLPTDKISVLGALKSRLSDSRTELTDQIKEITTGMDYLQALDMLEVRLNHTSGVELDDTSRAQIKEILKTSGR